MMNRQHPFALNSFRHLAEKESRHGRDLASLVPEVNLATKKLKDRREKFKQDTLSLDHESDHYLLLREKYHTERKVLREQRDCEINNALSSAIEKLEENLTAGSFSFDLKPGPAHPGRQTFRIDNSLSTIYAEKQATSIIKASVHGYTPSRNSIVRALKEALNRAHTHTIFRLDIQAFFDSIPHDKLLTKVNANREIESITKALVVCLLDELSTLSGKPIGIPQGVGMSSQLSELYLRDFDKLMRSSPGVLFYARYVDDVVMVLENEASLNQTMKLASQEIDALGLKLNKRKTRSIVTDAKGMYPAGTSLKYLGYHFSTANKRHITDLTKDRKERRKKRLTAAFESWSNYSHNPANPNTGLDGLLVSRVRYLAGNTRLLNSKTSVAIGIYFSNSSLDADSQDLVAFDTRLAWLIRRHQSGMSDELKTKLQAIKFVDGFQRRRFFRFGQRRIEQIVQCWQGEMK